MLGTVMLLIGIAGGGQSDPSPTWGSGYGQLLSTDHVFIVKFVKIEPPAPAVVRYNKNSGVPLSEDSVLPELMSVLSRYKIKIVSPTENAGQKTLAWRDSKGAERMTFSSQEIYLLRCQKITQDGFGVTSTGSEQIRVGGLADYMLLWGADPWQSPPKKLPIGEYIWRGNNPAENGFTYLRKHIRRAETESFSEK